MKITRKITVRVHISLDSEQVKRLDRMCEDTNRTRSDVVAQLIDAGYKEGVDLA